MPKNEYILIFSLGRERFGMNAMAVREILWLPELTPAEEMPAATVGMFDLRGKIVPVTDPNLRFGRPPGTYRLSDKVVVLDTASGKEIRSLIVDDVMDIVEITPEAVIGHTVFHTPHLITGEIRAGEHIVMVLDIERFFLDEKTGEETGNQGALLRGFDKASPEDLAVFRERAKSLAQEPAELAAEEAIPISVLRLNGELYGVELDIVQEFATARDVAPVPCTPSHIIGNMNLRGEILTLVDIRGFLDGVPEPGLPGQKVVVAGIAGLVAGLNVDEVLEILAVSPSEMKPAPLSLGAKGREYIRAEVPYLNEMVSIIDIRAMLSGAELVVDETA